MANIEEVRLNVALVNPTMTSAQVRAEAERVVSVLDSIEAGDAMKASYAAMQAEADQQQAADAQRRADAVNHNRGLVSKLHPGWLASDIDSEAQKWAAEDASAIAALNVREAIEAGGYDQG
jgi:hypothetical protein